MRTKALSKAPLAAAAAALAAAAVALAFAFSLPAAFASGESKAFTVTTEITATYGKDGAITVPDVKLTNDTGSAVVLKSAKMNSDYEFVSGWTNDAAGKVVAAGETVTIRWSANGSKVPDGWGKGEKVLVGAVTYAYEPVDAATTAKAIDFSKAGLASTEFTYDGTAKEPAVTGLDGLVEGRDYEVAYRDNVDAGTATATVTGIGEYSGSKNLEFEIAKRSVTLSSASASKIYDGTPLTSGDVAVSGDGFAEGEGVACSVAGAITDAGSAENAFTYVLNPNTKAGNYSVTKAPGTLTVNPVADAVTVTVKGNTGTATYDGNSHSVEGYTVSIDGSKLYTEGLVKFDGAAKAEGTDAGTYRMGLKAEQFSNAGKNFSNVKFVLSDGSCTISKRAVSLRSADLGKTYDGTPLVNGQAALAAESGWAEGQGATYSFTGSQTPAGSSDNAFGYELKEGTKASNYDIVQVFGKLTVAKSDDLRVAGKSYSGTYDGKAHGEAAAPSAAEGTTVEYSTDGETWSADAPQVKDAGRLSVKARATNPNYETAVATYALEVTPARATVTAASASKTYGEADPEFTAKVTGLVEGESESLIRYAVARSNVDVNDAGEYRGVIVPAGDAAQGNYTVAYVGGDFAISPKQVTEAELDKIGLDIPAGGYTYGADEKRPAVKGVPAGLAKGTDYDIVYSDNVNAGTAKATVAFKGNYKGSKTIEFDIAKKAVTVAWKPNGGADEFKYDCDGKAKTPSASITGAIGSDAFDAVLSYKNGDDLIESAPSEPGTYIATVVGLAAAEGLSALTSNYALPEAEADLSKSFTINKLELGAFWFAKAKADSPESTDGVLRGGDGAYKTEAQVKTDVAEIQKEVEDGTTEAPGSTFQEYKALMEGDAYHLYTKWKGDDATKDADKYVEFRIIQVGAHDNGGELGSDGSAVTFVATHSLPTAQQMNTNPGNAGGWEKSDMRNKVFGAGGYVQSGLSGLAGAAREVKKVAVSGNYDDNWSKGNYPTTTTSDSFWLLSYTEIAGTGSIPSYLKSEGSQYAWFGTDAFTSSVIASMYTTRSGSGPAGDYGDYGDRFKLWWLRSPEVVDKNLDFALVSLNGGLFTATASAPAGVVPAFSM